MGTLLVVEPEVGPQPRLQLWHTLILLDVYVFVFHAPPQPLYEHVVQRPPPPVPAHRNPGLLQAVGVLLRRELGPTVGVEDLRPAQRQRLVEGLQAEPPFQRVRQPPREHVPAEPVDHRRQVHESVPHWHICDVRTPDLVDVGQYPIAEQVGVDPRLRSRRGGPRPGKDRFQAHQSHEPLDPLAIDRLPGSLQSDRHLPAAVERGLEELLVDPPHQAQVLLRLDSRWEIVARSVETQQFALSTNAQIIIRWLDQGPLEVSRRGQLFPTGRQSVRTSFGCLASPCFSGSLPGDKALAHRLATGRDFFGRRPVLMVVEPESLCWMTGRMVKARDGVTWAEELARLPGLEAVV